MVKASESEIAKVRPEIFQSVFEEILHEREVVYDGYKDYSGFAAWFPMLMGFQSPRLKKFSKAEDISRDAYAWESKLRDKMLSLVSLKAPVIITRRELRQTVEVGREIEAFIRDRPQARPNYAKSYHAERVSSVWDVDEFVFTLDGEANLYLAIKDGQDPFSLMTEMLLNPNPLKADAVETDLVGIYLVSRGDRSSILYCQEGFSPKHFTFEEAWWLLQ